MNYYSISCKLEKCIANFFKLFVCVCVWWGERERKLLEEKVVLHA